MRCEKPGCCALVALKDLSAHVEVSFPLLEQRSDTTCTVGHILSKPLNTPTTDLEKQVASSIVQRMLGEQAVVQLPTARKVHVYIKLKVAHT